MRHDDGNGRDQALRTREGFRTVRFAGRYGVRIIPPADQPWGMRDFVVIDPTGVLWRIGQNIDVA
jgi:uncharacterized glyoxalase superfamily protein PhnB